MFKEKEFHILPETFYQQPTIEVANQLLGKILVHETENGTSSGIIVETEAYLGSNDRAAHSFENKRTKRTEILYGKAGLIYTYQMHTHCLINLVTGKVDEPEAVLIRAIEPYTGIEAITRRRPVKQFRELSNGPGKLTKALAITMDAYGHASFERPLYIAEGMDVERIESGPRIGIPNTKEARDYPYRFWVQGNSFVS